MRFGLGIKFSVAACAVVLIATFSTAFLFYRAATVALTDHELVDLQDETALRGQELRAALAQVRADGYQLAGTLSARRVLFEQFVRSLDMTIPAAERDALRLAELNKFAKVVMTLLKDRPHYLEMQYLARSDDQIVELMSVERRSTENVDQILPRLQPGRAINAELAQDEQFLRTLNSSNGDLILSTLRSTIDSAGNHPLELDAFVPMNSSNPDRKYSGVIRLRIDFSSLVGKLKRSPRHLVYLHDQNMRLLLHPDFLDAGAANDPNLVSHDEKLKVFVEAAQANILQNMGTDRSDAAALPRSPVSKTPILLNDPATILIRSERLPEKFDRIGLEKKLNKLADLHPDVRMSKIDSNSTYVYLASRDLTVLRKVQEAIEPGSTTELIATPGKIRWEPALDCKNFVFQYVMIPLEDKAIGSDASPGDATSSEARLPEQYFGLILAASLEEIDSDITQEMGWVLAWASGLGGLAAVLALGFAVWFTRPLNQMIFASEKLAKGEPVDLDAPQKRHDEIGVLARGFSEMIKRVQTREDALRESETRMRAILRAAGDAIITLDDQGHIESANRAACALFGYAQESDLIGQPYRLLIPKSGDAGATAARIRTAEATLEEITSDIASDSNLTIQRSVGIARELFVRSCQGRTFPVEVTASEVMLNARRIYVIIVRDITERKRVEDQTKQMNEELDARVRIRTAELEQANHQLEQARDMALDAARAKDSFVTTVSHELRTPLTAIIGYSEMHVMDFDPTDKKLKNDLGSIYQSGKHLLGLVNDILDYARGQDGKGLELKPGEFLIRDLLQEVESTMEALVQKNSNRYVLEADLDSLGSMWTDRMRVLQILNNLLSNANKFTDKGTITLKAVRSTELGTDWLTYSVHDSGLGMKPEEVTRLFTPFYQADSSTSRKSQGTGLGLTITRMLCRQMGGEVTVSSVYGSGSTFTIKLPARYIGTIAAPAKVPLAEQPMESSTPVPCPQGSVVLVIDDDAGVRDLMDRHLRKEGYTVYLAENGEQGMALAREVNPCAITLDAMMPGVDGWSVLAALKSDPITSNIPIIMATISEERTRGFALGATDYLTKPIDWSRLGRILNSVHSKKGRSPILVVEDDYKIRDLTVRTLNRAGWQVIQASNGREALNLPIEPAPALILLDLMMPEVDGFQYVEELRIRQQWTEVPIVVVTAAELNDGDRMRLTGRVQQVLQKNAYGPDELMEQIKVRVSRYAAAR